MPEFQEALKDLEAQQRREAEGRPYDLPIDRGRLKGPPWATLLIWKSTEGNSTSPTFVPEKRFRISWRRAGSAADPLAWIKVWDWGQNKVVEAIPCTDREGDIYCDGKPGQLLMLIVEGNQSAYTVAVQLPD